MADPRPTQQKRLCLHWLMTALIAMTISILSLCAYDTFIAPRILTVDLKGYMAAQKKRYLSGEINDADLKENIEQLQEKINSVPKNTTVLIEEVVVSNAKTLTP